MKDKVLSTIKEYNLIKENDNIVVGVSGGPDSMALIYILLEIRDLIPFNIYTAHVNHGVRGKEAQNDQLFVEEIANKLGLPYYTKNVDMIQYGKDNGISSEEAGRELRYGFFREILGIHGGGKIAVAHNMNDQAETLLMRFMRGTGIDGLKGMELIVGDIIRPILGIDRKEIEAYIKDNKIPTVLDKTNLMPIYTRNKVRLELIPYIEKNFNPNIINTLWRMSKISSLDSKFLEKHSQERYKLVVKKQGEHSIILDGKKFSCEDRAIQQRIIRISILKINGSLQGISESQISGVLNLIDLSQTGKSIDLSSGIVVKTSYDEIIIQKRKERDEKEFLYKLNLLETNNFEDLGYSFDIKSFIKDDDFIMNKDKNTRYFDLDKIEGDIRVRNRLNGDTFVPFGMKGTKKLKDYFINEKIPKDLRDNIPLIVDNKNIIWVVGYRTSELYKLTSDTKSILSISYKRFCNTY